MTSDILLLLVLLAGAVILFATEWIATELTAGLLLLVMTLAGLLPRDQVFAGFGSDVVLFLASVFVISQAFVRTGVLYGIERSLARAGERIPRRVLPILVLSTATLSSVLSNTATVAAMLPVASGLARRLRLSPSRIYMPLAFAAILGGSLTLIGTSTNIVVAAAMPGLGEPSWGLFELTPAALPAVALGLVYLLTAGRRLLPDRVGEVADLYRLREYVSEVMVPAGSPWVHRTLYEIRAGADLEITVLGRIGRGAVEPLSPDAQLQAGDRLLVKANHQALLRIKASRELDLVVDRIGEPSSSRAPAAHEVVLPHGSRLSGRTLRSLAFGTRYRVMVIALFRGGEPVLDRVADVTLRDGDVLLIQGGLEPLGELFNGGHLLLLEETPIPVAGARSWLAVGTFAAMLLVGGLGLIPFPLAAFAAAMTVLLARCLTPRQAYQSIDWGVLVLVGSLVGLGAAMEATGAGQYLATAMAGAAKDLGPLAVLSGFYLLTVALTQPMSNAAAALVMLPLAILTARELDLNPRAFAAAVTLAASCSFITPLEPASLLVYGPGRYRFRDYFVLGLPLTLLVFAANLFMVPRIWPLRATAYQVAPSVTSNFLKTESGSYVGPAIGQVLTPDPPDC